MSMERSNHLHNFSLPTWGTRKLFSCSNDCNPIRAMPVASYHESLDTEDQHYIEEEISATREKLLMEYQTDVSKMRERILKHKLSDDEIPPINVIPCDEIEERSKQKVTCNREVNEPRSEKKSMRPRRNLFKKDERPKFSLSLSKREIEEDLFAITGKRPYRKPKKRPRSLQTKIDALYPGSLLSEVHPHRYKVNEHL